MFGERLKSARRMAGLSLQSLADKMGNLVSKQALSKYEQNRMKPDGKVLSALSRVMDVSPDYFFRAPVYEIRNIEFRGKSRLNVTDQNRVRELSIAFVERNAELEDLLGIHDLFVFPVENKTVKTIEDIERIAEELRRRWNLGEWALPNVVELLENHGLRIFEVEAPEEFVGLSGRADRSPLIVLNRTLNGDLCRKRFTVLHEFAHLVLDFQAVEESRRKEKLCHSFAGAFLMPRATFIREFGSRRKGITLDELTRIKETFGISIQAIMARANSLGLIGVREYEQFNKWINRMGYRKNEPGQYCGLERSGRYRNLINRAVTEEIISISKAAVLSGQSLADFRRDFNEI